VIRDLIHSWIILLLCKRRSFQQVQKIVVEEIQNESKHIMKSTKLVLAILGAILVATAIIASVVVGGKNNDDSKNESNSDNSNDPTDEDSSEVDSNTQASKRLHYRNPSQHIAPGSVLECPIEFETSYSFLPEDDDSGASVNLPASKPGTLCTLVQVSPDGKFISPVARSYDGRDWEASAGKFAAIVAFKCTDDDTCMLNSLPALSAEGATYQLTSFDMPNYSTQDIIARFLEQTTFGASLDDINQFGSASNLEFAQWIQKQQDPQQMPIMSHRAIFRQHLNARFEVNAPIGPVTQPCQTGTRYRWTAFSVKDFDKVVNFRTFDRKIVLSVDGFDRTVLGNRVYVFDGGIQLVDWEDGDYRICYVYEDDGNSVLLLDHPELGECTPVVFTTSNNAFAPDYYSNPPILFDDFTLFGDVGPKSLIDIPDQSAEAIDTIYFPNHEPQRLEIIVTRELNDPTCAEIDPKTDGPVFAMFGKSQKRKSCGSFCWTLTVSFCFCKTEILDSRP
jgi:hypothetical protein